MTRIGFAGIAFVLHLVLGNVCLMGTAYAASPEAERFLSREVPMSYNVVTCAWVRTDDGWKPAENSPCASGHCLKKEQPEPPCLFGAGHEQIAAVLPVSPSGPFLALSTDAGVPALLTERPPPLAVPASVVFLM